MLYLNAHTTALLQEHFPGRVKLYEPLAAHCSAGVGGPAEFWIDIQSVEEMGHLAHLCAETHIPLLVIGNGSNLLFADAGMHGIVARMGAHSFQLEERQRGSALAVVDAGITWGDLAREMADQRWGGLEFGIGIPGTLGGALVTNAGAHNEEIGRHVQWVEVLDARGSNVEETQVFSPPHLHRYTQEDLQLGNRKSRFREQRRAIITSSGRLVPAPRPLITPPEILLRLAVRVYDDTTIHINERTGGYNLFHKRQVENFTGHVGPIFKDLFGIKASQLIEQAGMSTFEHPGVQVSPYNANFLVNRGGAKAVDFATTIVEIHQRVLDQLGLDLEVDLELYGAWDEEATAPNSPESPL